MASTARPQPPWTPPQASPTAKLPPLKIYNSLTRRKDAFVPVDDHVVRWYACGPTVYDDAHLGHARNYVSTDVIRRIMRDYFGFRVQFVMNITDVDDKIILRGRQQYLLARFKREHAGPRGEGAVGQAGEGEGGKAGEKAKEGDEDEDDGAVVPEAVLAETRAAFEQYVRKNLPLLPPDVAPADYAAAADQAYRRVLDGLPLDEGSSAAPGDREAKLRAHLRTAAAAAEALTRAPASRLADFYARAEDVLLPYLDARHGAAIDAADHSIFTALTQRFERRFFEDMRRLHVLDPDVLTRVTEFVPQIVRFVQRIVAHGFAYATADGSVYFDIDAFERAGHAYARLEPWNRNDRALLADGEGALSKGTLKRSENDFALWKASKPGEPAWPSPWGPGRPGWHIECSTMASEVLGKVLDIHSGGADLRFPHHDNELAQSEAYWTAGNQPVQWTNYFLHMGHLSIQGMKMSKSLKNFTTVRAALAQPEWTPRSLRICFLLGSWQDGIEVTEELLKATAAWESKLNNFFLKSVDAARRCGRGGGGTGVAGAGAGAGAAAAAPDKELWEALAKAQADLDAALCDSFNTPVAMRVLSDLVTEFNLARGVADETTLALARWVARIVAVFGLDPDGDPSDATRIAWSGVEIPPAAQPYVYPAAELRDRIRQLARSGSAVDPARIAQLVDETGAPPPAARQTDEETAAAAESSASQPYREVLEQFRRDVGEIARRGGSAQDLLALCDRLRDTHLWNLGVYLEDRDPPLPAIVRPVDRSLREARAERESAAAAKREARRRREAEEAERRRALDERAQTSPRQMFRTGEFSAWDADGIPVRDAAGEEITKSRRKKLVKEWERQKKLHEEWLARQGQ